MAGLQLMGVPPGEGSKGAGFHQLHERTLISRSVLVDHPDVRLGADQGVDVQLTPCASFIKESGPEHCFEETLQFTATVKGGLEVAGDLDAFERG